MIHACSLDLEPPRSTSWIIWVGGWDLLHVEILVTPLNCTDITAPITAPMTAPVTVPVTAITTAIITAVMMSFHGGGLFGQQYWGVLDVFV
jgi:hypothetical protein